MVRGVTGADTAARPSRSPAGPAADQAAPAPPPVQRFASGDRVSHPAFGSGTVVKSTLTRTDEELVIKFDKVGLKILSGMLAPLTK